MVVHLAAQVEGSDEARFGTTVVGTERLLEAIDDSTVTRLVLISSYSVYDWQQPLDVLDESAPVMTRPYGRDGYTVAKVWQERVVREFGARSHVETTILRPGFIWGPEREHLAGAGLRLGPVLAVVGPRMRLPLTFVENCAEAVAVASLSPRAAGETFNIVDGDGPRAWAYARFMARLDPSIRVRLPVPYEVGHFLVAVLAMLMPRIYRSGGKLPGALVPASYAARFRPLQHTGEKAMTILGWSPTVSFETAVAKSARVAEHA